VYDETKINVKKDHTVDAIRDYLKQIIILLNEDLQDGEFSTKVWIFSLFSDNDIRSINTSTKLTPRFD